MIALLIILASAGQVGLFLYVDNKKIKFGRTAAFLITLMLHYFVLPILYAWEMFNPSQGLVIPGVTTSFAALGTAAALVVTLVYSFIYAISQEDQ